MAASLALEEILLIYQSAMDTRGAFRFEFRKNAENARLRLSVRGERFDPQIGDNVILHQGTHRELLSRCGAYRELYETEDRLDGIA